MRTFIALTLVASLAVGCGGQDTAAEEWIEANRDDIERDVVNLILGADFGYGFGNDLVKRDIAEDVTRQVRSGLEVSVPASDSSKVTVVASVTVEIQTKATSSMSGLVSAPALEGQITATQPYELLISGEWVSSEWPPSGGEVSLDLKRR